GRGGLMSGGAETIKVGGYRSVTVGGLLTHDVAGVYRLYAGVSASQWALGMHDIRSSSLVRLMGGTDPFLTPVLLPVALATGETCEACGGAKCVASATVFATA
ncbi:hypothetical protein, partial [Candidatus Magnetobacterium casense]|uniref:hypothetical protein n=1 Tax=Candidatus Magnetobacterium casense TaxID=1455061 RepID=UPI001C4744AD